jgi:hypothetical protein
MRLGGLLAEMEKLELYVTDPDLPPEIALRCLSAAQRIFDKTGVEPRACNAADLTRDYVYDGYINTGPDPDAPSEVFQAYIDEHHPDIDMDEVHRLALIWEDAMSAAYEIALEVNPDRKWDWIVGLREAKEEPGRG